MMYRFYLGYKQYKLQVTLFALMISIAPYTRERNILALVNPFFDNPIIGLDDLFLATTEERPSIHLQYAVLITIQESTFDMLVRGLATAELFNVHLDPVRLGPDQSTLVRIPDGTLAVEHTNPDTVIQTLREECSLHKQESLACILHFHHVNMITVDDALLA